MKIDQFTRIGTYCEKCGEIICNCPLKKKKENTTMKTAEEILDKNNVSSIKDGVEFILREDCLRAMKEYSDQFKYSAGIISGEEIQEIFDRFSIQEKRGIAYLSKIKFPLVISRILRLAHSKNNTIDLPGFILWFVENVEVFNSSKRSTKKPYSWNYEKIFESGWKIEDLYKEFLLFKSNK